MNFEQPHKEDVVIESPTLGRWEQLKRRLGNSLPEHKSEILRLAFPDMRDFFSPDISWDGDGDIHYAGYSSSDLNGGADLSSTDLSSIDLSYLYLYHANLSGANLSDANFKGVNLSDANFKGANLSDANFKDANLSGVNFKGANLSDAADLGDADLSLDDECDDYPDDYPDCSPYF
ncbi:MAG TPA: pentapeptide repeat-containing protein [Candidatus Sericytochromatia bacterium]|jgi:hypothetical protein